MIDPSFSNYLDYVREERNCQIIYFIYNFRGVKNEQKFNEINAAMDCFAFKACKIKMFLKD